MNDSKVYWYSAEMRFSGYYQEYLFKSDHLYEVGDVIKKATGPALSSLLLLRIRSGAAVLNIS